MKTFALILCLFVVPVYATNYYIAASGGSDSNPGTIGSPFATFEKFRTVMAPGDTLFIRGGTYSQKILPTDKTGTRTQPIVYKEYPGESAILDGDGVSLTFDYGLVHFGPTNKYFTVSGLEIRNSSRHAVKMIGTGCIAESLYVHDIIQAGAGAYGDSCIIQDSRFKDIVLENFEGSIYYWYTHGVTDTAWSAGVSLAYYYWGTWPQWSIIRRCTVENSWGEGISTFRAQHTLMEDNVVCNAFSAHFYIQDSKFIVARGNLIYATKIMTGRTERSVGLAVTDEVPYTMETANDTIVDNIVWATSLCLDIGAPTTGTIVSNNTFMNATWSGVGTIRVYRREAPDSTLFQNNIIIQEDASPMMYNYTGLADWTLRHNHWSKAPPSGAGGTGDIIGPVDLYRTGDSSAGNLTRAWFAKKSTSDAINAGTSTLVPSWHIQQGAAYDMGAIEYLAPGAQTAAPVVTPPIYAGATSVSGTSESGASIAIYVNGNSVSTATASGTSWTGTVSALSLNDLVKAKATTSGKTQSEFSNTVTVTATPTVGSYRRFGMIR